MILKQLQIMIVHWIINDKVHIIPIMLLHKKIKCTHILCANELTKTHLYNNALIILDNSP